MISTPSKPIDAGEAWCAVLGLKPVLSKRVEKITDSQTAAVARLPETVRKRARSLVNDSIVAAPTPLVDYAQVLDDTSGTIGEAQIIAMIRPIPDEAQLPYMTVAHRAFAAAQQALPKIPYKTYAGTQSLPPDSSALLEYSEGFAAIDDPLGYVFGAIADGSLSRDVAKAVRGVYPSLSAAIDAAIHDATTEKVARSRAWVLPWRAEIGIAAWGGLPLETSVPSPDQGPPPEAPKDDDKIDTDDLTPSQRVEAGK